MNIAKSPGGKTPLYLQFSETECGIAALAMVLGFYKTHVSFDELREICGPGRDGCKASTLIKAAEEFGYAAECYSIEIDDIRRLTQPVIAYWKFNHYVVIKRVSNNKFYINDPAHGSLVLNFDEFDKSFTGIIILISPTEKSRKMKQPSIVFPLLTEWVRQYHSELIFIMICLILIAVCPLLNSFISALFINYCVLNGNHDWIPYVISFSMILLLLLTSAGVYQKWTQFQLCTKVSILKSSQIISHLLQLPLLFFSLRAKGEIISILSRLEIVINSLLKNLSIFTVNIFLSFACLLFMIRIDNYLAVLSLILITITLLTTQFLLKLNLATNQSTINTTGQWHANITSSIRNIETVTACGLEEKITTKLIGILSKKISLKEKLNSIIILIDEMNRVMSIISMLLILFAGSNRISNGVLSIGELLGYYSLHMFLMSNVSVISRSLKEYQDAFIAHGRIHDILQQKKSQRFLNNNQNPLINDKEFVITCDRVCFFYNKAHKPTVNNVNLIIPQGYHIGITGKTGSGKSSLAKLLCGLYQSDSGIIAINGIDIASLSASVLAQYFSYVSQDISLFEGSIYDNLVMVKENINPHILQQAIQDACLDEVIASRGLYGRVEENGDNFSGGEKQRIEIARALIQNTPVLVLDEATSALDIYTEKRLINNLRQSGKTVIFIAHRLSCVSHCNKIVVMEDGMIRE